LAREVVSRNPDVIVTIGSNDLALDFKAETTTIPIVGLMGTPVEAGIVASLARPGGNVTGVSVDAGEERGGEDRWDKRIQLLRQLVPHLSKLAVLDTRPIRDTWEALIPELSRRRAVTYVGTPLDYPVNEAEYRRVFAGLVQDHADGLAVLEDDVHIANAKLIAELAEQSRLPTIYPYKLFAEAGGLISYGIDVPVFGYNIADIIGQILKGTKPADIPVRQPTKFELVINLKAAKALGLTVPATLLVAADEVIE
jgi:putative ABC transport system substrate-binding protein